MDSPKGDYTRRKGFVFVYPNIHIHVYITCSKNHISLHGARPRPAQAHSPAQGPGPGPGPTPCEDICQPSLSGVVALRGIHFQGFDFFEVENTCPFRLVYSPCGESIFRVLTFCGSRSPPKTEVTSPPPLLSPPLPRDRSHAP